MSAEAMKDIVKNLEAYRAGKTFRAGDARYEISRRLGDVSHGRATEILRQMVEHGELDKDEAGRYQRRSASRALLRQPWRQHTNAELGITSRQFGVSV